jgi:diaminopimelate epimerase
MTLAAPRPPTTGHLHLGKYHGLGNDFLVWLTDRSTADAVDLAALARQVCDRHRGVGADGLLVGTPSDVAGGPLTMVLHNADGSRAEMSGNGIRCFVHAVARDAGMEEGELAVQTDAGLRTVDFGPAPDGDPRSIVATVDMGTAAAGPAPDTGAPGPAGGHAAGAGAAGPAPLRQAEVELGNPHLVLLVDDPAAVDRAAVGPAWEARYSHGINVHFVAPSADGSSLAVHTWERGAGLTEACGTGAAASAHAAHRWGLVGDHVGVTMPGGDVQVALGEPIHLTGPSSWIADVEVPCGRVRA